VISAKKPLLIGLAAVLWCTSIILLYYVAHKPFTLREAVSLGKAIWSLVVALAIISLSGGIGQRVFKADGIHPLARMALQAGLGLGILASSVLLVGGTLGVLPWGFWLMLLGLMGFFHRNIIEWWKQIRAMAVVWTRSVGISRWLAGLVGCLLLFSLLSALAPPLKFDSLVYHLVLPNAYLREGKILYLPWIVMSGMPQNAEMLYTWAIAMGGNIAATCLACLFGILTILGLVGYLTQRLDERSAWVGVTCLLAGYTTSAVIGWGYVDYLVMLAGLGVLVCLDNWRSDPKRSWLIFAGIFTGIAIGTKYTSGILAISGAAVVIWHSWRSKRAFLPSIFWYGCMATLVALPWFLKNLISTGNPVYPFLFPAGAVTPVRISVYQNLVAWGDWRDIFLLPLRATITGQDSGDGYMASIGPLLFGLAWLAWVGWKSRVQEVRASLENGAVVALVGWLMWAIGNQLSGNLIQTRYYFSVFPAFVLLAASGYHGLASLVIHQLRIGRILAALVVMVLLLNVIESGLLIVKQGTVPAMVGSKTEETYLAENLGWFQPAMKTIRELDEGKRTLLLFEPRSLYCTPRCAPDEILDRWKRDRSRLGDAESVRRAWLAEGFTHILFYRSGAEFLVKAKDPHHTEEDLDALEVFLGTLAAPIDYGGVYELYSIE
jgi:hypothetical protein